MMEKARPADTQEFARPRRRRRVVLASAGVALVVAATAVAAIGPNPLDVVAELTGIREVPPSNPALNYEPAAVPYISVHPLMNYVGSQVPVVPAAAVVSAGGQHFVFTLAGNVITYRTSNSYSDLIVRKTPVVLGTRIGKAVEVAAGLTSCSTVVADPPETLQDGDRIRSFHEQTAEGPNIDYAKLFGNVAPAPMPALEGGIAGGEGTSVTLAITYHGNAPEGATYRLALPNGDIRYVPFDTARSSTDVSVPRRSLVPERPVARVELRDGSGETMAEGNLETLCF